MAEQQKDEKRTHVRVDLATQVKVQQVSREAFEHQKSMRLGGFSSNSSTDDGGIDGIRLGYLIDRLNRVEEKIDRILEKLDPDHEPTEIVSYGKAQNVSGAGVNLILEDAFEPGQLVMVSLSVPGFSIGFLQAYGEIVRVNPQEGEGRPSYETSIKFLMISEEEREKLIAYAFQRQRELIRNSALAKERTQELPSVER